MSQEINTSTKRRHDKRRELQRRRRKFPMPTHSCGVIDLTPFNAEFNAECRIRKRPDKMLGV